MKSFLIYIMLLALPFWVNAQDTIKKAQLKEVKIGGHSGGTEFKELTPVRIEKMNHYELQKNACCNLAESFESSPTVEVSFSNAVTGARQIQLLGLSGVYVQQVTDLLPSIRGLNYTFGLDQIPATQADAIYVNKGPGSVVNGFESMTGLIDIELQKPEKMPRLFVNAYLNSQRRSELNLQGAKALGQRWNTALFTHFNHSQFETDANKDHLVDGPLNKQFSFMNRWKYNSYRHVEAQFGIKGLVDQKYGGQTKAIQVADKPYAPAFLFSALTKHAELFSKTSYNFDEHGDRSIGVQALATFHQVDAYYGGRAYIGKQFSEYLNLIYQTKLKTESHILRSGLSVLADQVDERYVDQSIRLNQTIPGVFSEYTYAGSEKYAVLLGMRLDYQNTNQRIYFTPRAHFKYSLTKTTSVRLSAGTGFRTAFIFAENPQLFVSRRQVQITTPLLPEHARNIGINITQKIKQESHLSVDVFRTDFMQQVIADYDLNPHYVLFYNLSGKSYSTYVQAELYLELNEQWHTRFAYKYNDVKCTYHGVLLEKALNAKHRALGNIAYDSKDKHWKVDFTAQWLSKQRLPDFSLNPVAYQLPAYSPSFFRFLGQVTYIHKAWEWYIGSENLSNYTQKTVAIAAADPSSSFFDSGVIWGPVMGRIAYLGCRWTLK